MGFSIQDLKQITYVDAMKVILTFIEKNEDKTKTNPNTPRIATQKDIDKFLGG